MEIRFNPFLQFPEGVQIFLELIDSDFLKDHELIDRFVINVTSFEQAKKSYSGIFGLAWFNITTQVSCQPEFTGEFCDTPLQTLATSPTTDDTTTENADTTLTTTSSGNNLQVHVKAATLLIIIFMGLTFITVIVITCVCVIRRRKAKQSSEAVRYLKSSGKNDGELTEGDTVHGDHTCTNSDAGVRAKVIN